MTENPRYVVIHRGLYPRRIEVSDAKEIEERTYGTGDASALVSSRTLDPKVLHPAAQGTGWDAETCCCSVATFEAPISQ
jgi:hypothetical protein